MRADGISAYSHALDHAVRVAFQDRAVHERTRVAFVGVAENVLDVALLLLGELPLEAGGEAGAATAAQPALQHLVDDLFRGHLGEHLGECLIALAGDVLVDAQRVDDARVAQDDLHLTVEELDVAHLGDRLVGAGRVADEALYHAPLEQVLLDEVVDVLDLDVLVEDAVRVDQRHRAVGTRAQAAGLDDPDLVPETLVFQLFDESRTNSKRARGDAAAAGAHQHVASDLLHSSFLRSLPLRVCLGMDVRPGRSWTERGGSDTVSS